MITLSIHLSLGLGILYEKNRLLEGEKSYEIRYRIIGLELPKFISLIDSTYTLDPNKFHDLVIKREEENKLLNIIDRR